ncbi:uncharacterized protein MKZ38_001518 [Zalerion maritima]|uniref:rRNA methyltransferase 2, mitochondrial n=1 Tax=Zalerion maritima TaxID=339359 RepID=A0AAD5RRQ3_9PEZI|nr:uncharacterized protein MKZ38_001518 [Zalerion maritima]
MNKKFNVFRPGQTVVDLGFAPGSWSQVAYSATRPGGRIIGIDLIPAVPPDGVFSIQGDFLDPRVHQMVKSWLLQQERQKQTQKEKRKAKSHAVEAEAEAEAEEDEEEEAQTLPDTTLPEDTTAEPPEEPGPDGDSSAETTTGDSRDVANMKVVDVVLSDMLMNTSGIAFKDHAASMDLCLTALNFATETLKPGGRFVCKFYQGAEDKELELALKNAFDKVFREKPDSSRKESKEAYFVALHRKNK